MKIKQLLACVLASTVLVACNDQDNNKSTLIKDKRFEAYLTLKRIPLNDDKRIATALAIYEEREAISEAIAETGLLDTTKIEVEVDEFHKQLLISRYFEAYTKKNVTDDSVRNYYNNNPEEFSTRKIHIAHILFRTNARMSDDEKNARLLKAKEAYTRIQQQQAFDDLVKEYSDDKLSVQKAGDLGWIKEGAIDPVFSKRIFSMKEDEISEPFVTSFGYHIVKVLEGKKEIKKTFESVKGDITYRLKQQAKEAEMNRLHKLAK